MKYLFFFVILCVCAGALVVYGKGPPAAPSFIIDKKHESYYQEKWCNAVHGITDILTSCSGCNSTFRHDYPALAKEYGLDFNFHIFDVGEYMSMMDRAGTPNINDLHNVKMRCMYHYPCHIRASGLDESIYTLS